MKKLKSITIFLILTPLCSSLRKLLRMMEAWSELVEERTSNVKFTYGWTVQTGQMQPISLPVYQPSTVQYSMTAISKESTALVYGSHPEWVDLGTALSILDSVKTATDGVLTAND